MNTTNEPIDRLTRNLMKDTAEQPSPSLNARIMALIMAEKRIAVRSYYVKKLPPVGLVMGLLLAYVLLMAGGILVYMNHRETGEVLLRQLKHFFPLMLTVSSSISIFFFFSKLDGWLRMREQMKKNN